MLLDDGLNTAGTDVRAISERVELVDEGGEKGEFGFVGGFDRILLRFLIDNGFFEFLPIVLHLQLDGADLAFLSFLGGLAVWRIVVILERCG